MRHLCLFLGEKNEDDEHDGMHYMVRWSAGGRTVVEKAEETSEDVRTVVEKTEETSAAVGLGGRGVSGGGCQ